MHFRPHEKRFIGVARSRLPILLLACFLLILYLFSSSSSSTEPQKRFSPFSLSTEPQKRFSSTESQKSFSSSISSTELQKRSSLHAKLIWVLNQYRSQCNPQKTVSKDILSQYENVASEYQYSTAAQDAKEVLEDSFLSPRFCKVEFPCFSQTTEDGILLYIFAIIGAVNKKAVEICSGLGYENNLINLAVNHGWKTLMFDGSEENEKAALNFFKITPMKHQPVFVRTFVITETISDQVKEKGFDGEIDLFSLDMDGVDYWILKTLITSNTIKPRVIVLETQEIWGSSKSFTRPYRSDHVSKSIPEMGAGIMAFANLLEANGYRLIGCIEAGFNAFFMRNDVGTAFFPSYAKEACFTHVDRKWRGALKERLAQGIAFDWIEVVKDPISPFGVKEIPVSKEKLLEILTSDADVFPSPTRYENCQAH